MKSRGPSVASQSSLPWKIEKHKQDLRSNQVNLDLDRLLKA